MPQNSESAPPIKRDATKVTLSPKWLAFGPVDRKSILPPELLVTIRDSITFGDVEIKGRLVTPTRGQKDFEEIVGPMSDALGKAVFIFVTIHADSAGTATFGLGWDNWLCGWLNGEPLFDGAEVETRLFPPSMAGHLESLNLQKGHNILALRLTSGLGRCMLALGGPQELAEGDFRSILEDPLATDPTWTEPHLQASPGGKAPVEIGSRRELFIDEFLIDALTGSASRRLHHPTPREVVLKLDQPWEGNFSGNFMPVAIVPDNDRHLLYYYAANWQGAEPAHEMAYELSKKRGSHPVTCVAETRDGIHFTRPRLDALEATTHPGNNIVWNGLQYFTPFKDENPSASPDERFKAIAKHPSGALAACVSPDGLHWQLLGDEPIVTEGAFDSQNLAFWDAERRCYVEYHRGPKGETVRGIMTSTSKDFVNWSRPEPLIYSDTRPEQMYTNCIQPYARAPHIYLGTPARYVGQRQKVPTHREFSISDAILMSSRDGKHFDRWEEGFIRPGLDPELWTDRNNYPAWGLIQTSESELSLYWCEHNGHADLRLRRGTLRVDGFVSLHAPGSSVGEMLTRPMVFDGNCLEINFATSAPGTLLFELCEENGKAIEGYHLADSEVVYGNEISHIVTWRGSIADLSHLRGRSIRIRVRLKDADLYSFRFPKREMSPKGRVLA